MKVEKKYILRAFQEIKDNIANLYSIDTTTYCTRLKQLFLSVGNNDILKSTIMPYIENDLDDSDIGFIEGAHTRVDYVIPVKDDDEISLLLKVLNLLKDNETMIMNYSFRLYNKPSPQDNLDMFNEKIVKPGF